MELSGNLWELVVWMSDARGRAFTGTHGDGLLTSGGAANASTWPNSSGVISRGGSWVDNSNDLKVSDRFNDGVSFSNRSDANGFRAVRR
jgi:hypothetical protein